jgi:predicted nucleic acid-binding Zn ribbon protein
MKQQYKYVCPNCGEVGYVCKDLFKDECTRRCVECDEVLTLRFNSEKEEFKADYYFTYPQRDIYG